MKKVKVKRSAQTTYTFLPERFCTYCGSQGIYENDSYDYYAGNSVFCFACIENQPDKLWNTDETLPKLLGREPVVVDRKEWEGEISEFEAMLENAMGSMIENLTRDMLRPTRSEGTCSKPIPIRYGPKGET